MRDLPAVACPHDPVSVYAGTVRAPDPLNRPVDDRLTENRARPVSPAHPAHARCAERARRQSSRRWAASASFGSQYSGMKTLIDARGTARCRAALPRGSVEIGCAGEKGRIGDSARGGTEQAGCCREHRVFARPRGKAREGARACQRARKGERGVTLRLTRSRPAQSMSVRTCSWRCLAWARQWTRAFSVCLRSTASASMATLVTDILRRHAGWTRCVRRRPQARCSAQWSGRGRKR